jgi:hypothetical protein
MMTRTQLEELIKTSLLLTDREREYWQQKLPTMNAEQTAKLEQILSTTVQIPFLQQIEEYVVALAKAGTAALEKLPDVKPA